MPWAAWPRPTSSRLSLRWPRCWAWWPSCAGRATHPAVPAAARAPPGPGSEVAVNRGPGHPRWVVAGRKRRVVLEEAGHGFRRSTGHVRRSGCQAPGWRHRPAASSDRHNQQKGKAMAKITVGQQNSDSIDIYYEDNGSGQAVVLIHGSPLNGHSWEKQERVLLAAGYRVITYDRRGFGQSGQPTVGYDYDTFAADLHTLVEHLDLTGMVLAGFSMGTGEVTRYLGTYGSGRVRKAVLMGAIPPFLLKTADNPDGVDQSVFDGIKAAVVADRPAYFKDFLDNFYNTDVLRPARISDQAWQNSFNVAVTASAYAAYACVDTWLTDFRTDLPNIDVPVLLVHGDADRILPYAATAARLPGLIKDLEFVTVEGGPHNVAWTHPEVVNTALLDFLAR